MSTVQRTYAMAILIVAALALHLLLCKWGAQPINPDPYRKPIVVLWTSGPVAGSTPWEIWHGLLAQPWVSRGDAAVFGVVVPFLLLGAAGYLQLGWRANARRAAGRCVRCGYDLQSAPTGPCPECGDTLR